MVYDGSIVEIMLTVLDERCYEGSVHFCACGKFDHLHEESGIRLIRCHNVIDHICDGPAISSKAPSASSSMGTTRGN
jgi:hypothetical protein